MLLTEEKKFLRKNLRHGDVKLIHELVPQATYAEITAILRSDLWGEHGEAVVKATFRFLKTRLEEEKQKRIELTEFLKSLEVS